MSTFKDKLNYLVNGYVSHEIERANLTETYPSEINLFIIQFLENIFLRFDLVNKLCRDCIKNDGTLLVRDDNLNRDLSILSSCAFVAGTVDEFRIKCNKPIYDSIGIISDAKIVKKVNKYHSRMMHFVFSIMLEDSYIKTYGSHGRLY